MEHVLAVNSFLGRHCGQNLSRVQGQGLLWFVFGFCPIYFIKNIILLGAPFVLKTFLDMALGPPQAPKHYCLNVSRGTHEQTFSEESKIVKF